MRKIIIIFITFILVIFTMSCKKANNANSTTSPVADQSPTVEEQYAEDEPPQSQVKISASIREGEGVAVFAHSSDSN